MLNMNENTFQVMVRKRMMVQMVMVKNSHPLLETITGETTSPKNNA